MLFRIHRDTPKCEVLEKLNEELLHFLEAAIDSEAFGPHLFSNATSVCNTNEKTNKKFENLWQTLRDSSPEFRASLHQQVQSKQTIEDYFTDKGCQFPEIRDDAILEALKTLCGHLYYNTKTYSSLEDECDQGGIDNHFERFRSSNGNVCCVCGTELLAQERANTSGGQNQWRSDYDHLLGYKKYPVYAVHPLNLLPTCRTCNQKAKGTKELLTKKQTDGTDLRRLAFYPYSEATGTAASHLEIILNDQDSITPQIEISWSTTDSSTLEKLEAWDEVYQIRSRIVGGLCNLAEWLDALLKPRDEDDFRQQIERHATVTGQSARTIEWSFWKTSICSWLNSNGANVRDRIWSMIEVSRDDQAAQELFEI